ncbi:MAG: hypothetical protein ACRECO_02055 [Xanthobacteraceae bacterium]
MLAEIGRLTKQHTNCIVASKGGCEPIRVKLREARRGHSDMSSKAHVAVRQCFAARQRQKQAEQREVACQDMQPAGGGGNSPPLENPDRAALKKFQDQIASMMLDASIKELIKGLAPPIAQKIFTLLTDTVESYRTAATRNALAHVRSTYHVEAGKIVALEIRAAGARRHRWDHDASRQLLRSMGGTVWIEDVPIATDRKAQGVFWHPDPDFQPHAGSSGRLSMYRPECTADRPFGNQERGSVLRAR